MRIRAAVCRAFQAPLTVEEIDLAGPGPGEVTVKIAACAICHSDLTYISGGWGGVLPAVYGHEASGVVSEVGAGVTHVASGDHVVVTLIRSCGTCHYCAQGHQVQCETKFPLDRSSALKDASGAPLTQGLRTGAFAEAVTVHGSQIVAIPKDVPLDSASLLACGVITGLGAVTSTARVPAGATVVVIGCGGVGLNSVQGAALSGAAVILGIDLADDKLEAAKRFGATHVANPKQGDVVAAVKAATGGRGADYVFVTVGAKAAFEQAADLVAPVGTVVIVGMPASDVRTAFDPGNFAHYGQRMLGSKMGSARIAVDIPMLVDLYRQGRLKLDQLISGRYPLERINEALDSVRRGEALRHVIQL
ncbi:MAG: Zn-dependent alcohol dehydrogenase [Geminicoccaceae bacterium]